MITRRVFFSFHYARDVRRIQQVRNSWVVRENGQAVPFYDHADFEEAKRRAGGIQNWIDEQLNGASVTAVLFGAETYEREWVRYEIRRSRELGKGILAIDIHNVKDPIYGTDAPGRNPLDYWRVGEQPLSQIYRTYDWVRDDGFNNIARWIDQAARQAGR